MKKNKRSRPVNELTQTRKARHLRSIKHKVNLLSLIICFIQAYISKRKDRFLSLITCLIALLSSMTLVSFWPPFSFAQIRFEDASESAGISRWGDSFGASWGDFNGDGWPDLWLGNHCLEPALFLNNKDGTFTEVTNKVKNYDKFEQHGAAWADFDNDGDEDLLQIVGGGREKGIYPNQFFINSGGILQNKAVDYGLDYPLGRGRTPLWFDWNSDGQLDVFVSNLNRTDGKKSPSALFTRHGNFFKNENGLAIETELNSQFAQLFIPSFKSRPAIIVAGEDYYPLRVYQYDNLPFHDITDTIGFSGTTNVSDAAIADFNNDLLNDFFLVTAPYGSIQKDRLLIQTLRDFQDTTAAAGIDKTTSCWSVAAADFDNDMDIDLYLVCSGLHCNSPDILYENSGNGTFKEVSASGGAEGSSYGRGDSVATADYNNDGFVDLFVTNQRDAFDKENGHNQLFRNVRNSNHWIEIDLEGAISNRDGIGALILASSGGITQMRVQDGGMHRFSQNHQRIHFGLGKNRSVENLTIQWPSGIVQKIDDIRADQIIRVVELDFTGSATSGTPPLQVDFFSNTRGSYQPISYEWDFDNNGTIDSTVKNPSYTFYRQGTYTVKLIVKNIDGSIYTSIRGNYIKLLRAE